MSKRGQILGVLAVGGSMATAAAVGCCARTIYNTANRDPAFFERRVPLLACPAVFVRSRIGVRS